MKDHNQPTTDSYVSLADVESYAASDTCPSWQTATAAEKKAAKRLASEHLDRVYRWVDQDQDGRD
jgi:hypothetical protein